MIHIATLKWWFNSVYFVYEELDPSSDNWEDCGIDGDCSILDEDETQKTTILEFLGFSKADKEKAAADSERMKREADKRRADKAKEKEQKEREFDAKMAKARQSR